MGAKLQIIAEGIEPFEVNVGNTATIGRARESTVCLNFNPLVSRQHALVRCHNGYEYQLVDLGSRNGTFVNGQRVVMPVTLADGARISIAGSDLVFSREADSAGDDQLDATIAGSIAGMSPDVRSVALMVCDIRGFSTISERISSSSLAQALGAWFREVGNIVQRSGGTIDKFIGDAVLAYWSERPEQNTPPGQCDVALDAARQLQALAKTMSWPENQQPFEVAVALHFGRVTCSNIGLVSQRDATIIGDAVNTVFRLESASKEFNQPILLSDEFRSALADGNGFVELGEKLLKGKRQPVRLFGLSSAHAG